MCTLEGVAGTFHRKKQREIMTNRARHDPVMIFRGALNLPHDLPLIFPMFWTTLMFGYQSE